MGRAIKTLADYGGCSQVDTREFNAAKSQDRVDFVCTCATIVESRKRLIAARLLAGRLLLCDSCKNKENRK